MPGRNILVVGLGVSGIAICEALTLSQSQVTPTEVIATDSKHPETLGISPEVLNRLSSAGCRFVFGTNDIGDVARFDEIIVSPGVPPDIPLLKKARLLSIPVIGELEWAWRYINSPVIAVTGTNGKTTTTELIGSIMNRWKKRVFVGGNIGVPLSRAITNSEPWDIIVLEVSSFQLDTAPTFTPSVFVILNITEDHLDRYSSFEDYARSKISPILRQKEGQWAIVNGDDRTLERLLGEAVNAGKVNPDLILRWSRKNPEVHGFIREDKLSVKLPRRGEVVVSLENSRLIGAHNRENMAAAAMASLVFEVPPEIIEETFRHFSPGPHRIEFIDSVDGVDFYDDSKATNVDAVIRALECFEGKKVWLLIGGKDKGGSYDVLLKEAAKRCRGICLFGEARNIIREAINCSAYRNSLETLDARNLEEAFKITVERVKTGEVVLLSPACSSFDQYRNYAERGDHFKKLVKIWKELKSRQA